MEEDRVQRRGWGRHPCCEPERLAAPDGSHGGTPQRDLELRPQSLRHSSSLSSLKWPPRCPSPDRSSHCPFPLNKAWLPAWQVLPRLPPSQAWPNANSNPALGHSHPLPPDFVKVPKALSGAAGGEGGACGARGGTKKGGAGPGRWGATPPEVRLDPGPGCLGNRTN